MPILIVSVLIQVAFLVHIVKTGRSTTWIWIVLMLPVAGSIAYFVVEIVPGLASSRTGRQAGQKVQSVINPNKDINAAADRYAISDSVENTMRLAQECYDKGMYDQAKELYSKCLQGLHADDPHLMHELARVEFQLGSFVEAKTALDKLIELNPDFNNADAHLLYARTLEQLGDTDGAIHEYESLHGYYAGPQANLYFAKLLKSQGETDRAKTLYREIVKKSELSGRHYNSVHKDWIKKAKSEVVG